MSTKKSCCEEKIHLVYSTNSLTEISHYLREYVFYHYNCKKPKSCKISIILIKLVNRMLNKMGWKVQPDLYIGGKAN